MTPARRRTVWWIVSVAVVGLGAFVLIWFQPQKLLIEDTVDEAIPTATPAGRSTEDEEGKGGSAGGSSTTLATGPFHSLEHDTSGTATILELSDGRRFLRFEDLDTSNGPDLRVYLSEIPASDDWRAYGERFVDLGALKGNQGDQNYELPDDIELDRYVSAVIWCRRFTVGFGVAPLDRS